MRQAVPYLMFNGNAKEALEFYKELFNGEISNLQTYGELANFPVSPEQANNVLHAQFKKGDFFFMASDTYPGGEFETGSSVSLVLEFDDAAEQQRIYDEMSKNGTVQQELQDTFWGARYAKVKDAYGISWDLNHQKG